MSLYAGVDLHSNNNYVAIQDEEHRDVVSYRLRNELERVLDFFEPFREELESIAIESTYNWYWLADGLMDAGYTVKLVNTTKARIYSGLKYTNDKHDARWLCRLQILGILPEGYIMPREERGVRDLLRRRTFMVQKRTSFVTSVGNTVARSIGRRVSAGEIEGMDESEMLRLVDSDEVAESIRASLAVVRVLREQIKAVERVVLARGRLREEFELLCTAPGIGEILAMTIMCETGDISRFAGIGNYTSYCRTVKSEYDSNGKTKGHGNRKNGNAYLSWAYSEAAHHAAMVDSRARRYLDRKLKTSHSMVAKRALANKMARGCFTVLRHRVPFDSSRLFP